MDYFDLNKFFNTESNRADINISLNKSIPLNEYDLLSLNKVSLVSSNLPSYIVCIDNKQLKEDVDKGLYKTLYKGCIVYKMYSKDKDPFREIGPESFIYRIKEFDIYFNNKIKVARNNIDELYCECNNNDESFFIKDINIFLSDINNQIRNVFNEIFNEIKEDRDNDKEYDEGMEEYIQLGPECYLTENHLKCIPSISYDYNVELLKYYYPLIKYSNAFLYTLNINEMVNEYGDMTENMFCLGFNKQFYKDLFKTMDINKMEMDKVGIYGAGEYYTFNNLQIYFTDLINFKLNNDTIEGDEYFINSIKEDIKLYGHAVREINIYTNNIPISTIQCNTFKNNSFSLINNGYTTDTTGDALLTKLIIEHDKMKLCRLDYANGDFVNNSIKLFSYSTLQNMYIYFTYTDKFNNQRDIRMSNGDYLSLMIGIK